MRLKNLLNEIQAEIVGDTIPANKLFSDNGNTITLPPGSEWRRILGEILVAIKKYGLQDDFKRDLEPIDIKTDKAHGTVSIVSDSGKKYIYNMNNKKFSKA